MAAVLTLLVWGALYQKPRLNPFFKGDWKAWLLTRFPHPGYSQIPVIPVGSRSGFAPRELCEKWRKKDNSFGVELDKGNGVFLLQKENNGKNVKSRKRQQETKIYYKETQQM